MPVTRALPWVRDPEVSACYAKLTDHKIVATVPAGPSVNFDVDWTGRPVGIEVLGSADWVAQLVKLFLRGEVRLVHGFETDDEYVLVDLPCGCQDVHYADGRIDCEHDHVVCDGKPKEHA